MKKFLAVLLTVLLVSSFVGVKTSSGITASIPVPSNFAAYSYGTSITLRWDYSYSGIWSLKFLIEEYNYSTHKWVYKGYVTYPTKKKTFTQMSYGKHSYRIRAMEDKTSPYPDQYSNYTSTNVAYVLKKPTGFTASMRTISSPEFSSTGDVTLKWNVVDGYSTNVAIWRKKQGTTFVLWPIKILSWDKTSWTDTTALPNTTYTYWVQAMRDDGSYDDFSFESSSVTLLTYPAPPTSFTANAIGKTVYMGWNHTKQCDGYKIYERGTGLVLQWTLVKTIANKNTLHTSITVPDFRAHTYQIRAYNASGLSPSGLQKTAYALATPTGLTATALSSTSIKLNWDHPVDSNATQIVLSKSTDGNSFSAIGTFSATASYATVSGLSPETQYWFLINLRNGSNESNSSNVATATTPPAGTAPNAPGSLSATANSCSEVALSWTDNADNEDHFVVERKEAGGTYSVIATLDPDTTAYTDSSATAETTYYYRVKATNSIGDSSYSNEANVNVPVCGTAPDAPGDLTATAVSSSEIDLSWTDNSDNEDGFKIERKISGGTYSVIASVGANIVSYNNIFLLPDTTYYYRVRAYNSFGYSNYSNEISIATLPEVKQIIIRLHIDNPYMYVNETKQEIDPGRGTKPVIIAEWSRTVVPIRAVVETLGGTISWDGIARKVTIQFKGTTIELWIDNPQARVNGTAKWIDQNNHNVKPIIINNRTMLPLRFVAESLGCKVDWDGTTKEVKITYPKP